RTRRYGSWFYPRLLRGGLHVHVVAKRGELAVRRGCQPDLVDHRWTVPGEGKDLPSRQRNLDRIRQRAGGQSREDSLRVQRELGTEASTYEGRVDRHALGVQEQGFGQRSLVLCYRLRR